MSPENKLILYENFIEWHERVPVPNRKEIVPVELVMEEQLRLECQHFINCIVSGKQPLTDGNEGLRVLKVLNAAQESIDQNSATIQISGQGGHAGDMGKGGPRPVLSSSDAMTDVFVHDSSIVDDNSHICKGTKIWHFSHVLGGTTIGENCNIGQNVVLGPDVRV